MAVRFAIQLSNQNIEWSKYLDCVKAADEMGYDCFWTFDHLMPIGGDMNGPCFESYSTMAAFAQATKRIRISALVTATTYRNPAMQVKLATQLDVIAGGRFIWGVGAGWAEREFKAYHMNFGAPKERIGTLRETIELAKLMWSGDPHKKVSYDGKYVKATDIFLNPQPVQKPRPPILVGGSGEQLTLRVVARHADMWHGFGDQATLTRKLGLIDQYARGYGRDPAEITRCTSVPLWVGDPPSGAPPNLISGSPEAIEKRLRGYMDLGIGYFMVNSPMGPNIDNWRRVSEQIIPRFAG